MMHDCQFDATAERLRALCKLRALSAQAVARAQDLLTRLETPVRVALVGPEPAGRAAAVAALAGEPALPDLPDRPTVELIWGMAPRNEARLACGRRIEVARAEEALGDPEAVMVTLERPLPLLKRMRFVDLVTDTVPQDLMAALAWAARRADVFVWWSSGFGDAEREAWRAAPARLRDHGFLVLWGADGAGARHADVAAPDDFLRVIAAGAAQAGDNPGLETLAAELARHVDLGRQADNDAALLFLQKHERLAQSAKDDPFAAESAAARLPPRAEEPPPAPARPAASRPAPAPIDIARASPPSPRPVLPAGPTGRAGEISAPSAVVPAAARRKPVPSLGDSALRDFCREAAAQIRVRARTLRETDLAAKGRAAPRVVRHCALTVQALVERLDSSDDAELPEFEDLSNLLATAEETLVLLDAEGAAGAQLDAVRLMLQLRREIEARAGT